MKVIQKKVQFACKVLVILSDCTLVDIICTTYRAKSKHAVR